MIRKTVAINDNLFHTLEAQHLIKEYQSFSELVSTALELLIKQKRKERYKQAMIEASKDKVYLQDIQNIQEDFKYADMEVLG